MNLTILRSLLLLVLLSALLSGCGGDTLLDEASPTPMPEPVAGESSFDLVAFEQSLVETVERVLPSVVTLRIETAGFGTSFGSGVLISEDGEILTNDHVVENAVRIEALLINQDTYVAHLVGHDPFSDVALLKIEGADDLRPVAMGSSGALRVGQFVLAFGNAFGYSNKDAQPTVTHGIVSALDRVTQPLRRARLYRGAIQHDASINPGNSGGPLTDLRGRLVGLNGVISSETGNSSGVSLAIPIDWVRLILPDLRAGRPVAHAWIGIARLSNVVQQREDGPGRRGVEVGYVLPDSPAEEGGLLAGDIIVYAEAPKEGIALGSGDGDASVPVTGKTNLINWLGRVAVGTRVTLRVFRPDAFGSAHGRYQDITINVEQRPE